MRIQTHLLSSLVISFTFLSACGQTGQTPLDLSRDTYDSQQLSSEEPQSDDDELLEDTVASKPETISGMYLSDLYMTCSIDPNIEAPVNHTSIGCLAIDEETEEIVDIASQEDVTYTVASGESKENPKNSVVTLRDESDKEDYEKSYWSMTMIAPLGQKTILVSFSNADKEKQSVELKVHETPEKDVKKAWVSEDLSIPKVFQNDKETIKNRSISSLHGEGDRE